MIWLDLPRRTVMRGVVGRTRRRMLTREELWNGNRESLRNLFRRDPAESIIRWAWTQHHAYRTRYAALAEGPEWAHIRFVRVTSRREAGRLVDALGEGVTDGV